MPFLRKKAPNTKPIKNGPGIAAGAEGRSGSQGPALLGIGDQKRAVPVSEKTRPFLYSAVGACGVLLYW